MSAARYNPLDFDRITRHVDALIEAAEREDREAARAVEQGPARLAKSTTTAPRRAASPVSPAEDSAVRKRARTVGHLSSELDAAAAAAAPPEWPARRRRRYGEAPPTEEDETDETVGDAVERGGEKDGGSDRRHDAEAESVPRSPVAASLPSSDASDAVVIARAVRTRARWPPSDSESSDDDGVDDMRDAEDLEDDLTECGPDLFEGLTLLFAHVARVRTRVLARQIEALGGLVFTPPTVRADSDVTHVVTESCTLEPVLETLRLDAPHLLTRDGRLRVRTLCVSVNWVCETLFRRIRLPEDAWLLAAAKPEPSPDARTPSTGASLERHRGASIHVRRLAATVPSSSPVPSDVSTETRLALAERNVQAEVETDNSVEADRRARTFSSSPAPRPAADAPAPAPDGGDAPPVATSPARVAASGSQASSISDIRHPDSQNEDETEQRPRTWVDYGRRKQAYACARGSRQGGRPNLNEDITSVLEEAADVLEKAGESEVWRARSYKQVATFLKWQPRVTSGRHALELARKRNERGGAQRFRIKIGERMAAKIDEILQTGTLQKRDYLVNNDEFRTIGLFKDIHGVGDAVARSWYAKGLRTLDDVRARVELTRTQAIGLRYIDEFKIKIPRAEVQRVQDIVRATVRSVHAEMDARAVGSFRRGKAECGDIDILVSRPDSRAEGLLPTILDRLFADGLLTDALSGYRADDGDEEDHSFMGVCMLPDVGIHRRIDIKVYPTTQFPYALLYFTGNGYFNRSMRLLAKKMGLSLTDKFLARCHRANGEKTWVGPPFKAASEADIFRHLGLEYRRPEDRSV